jgi:hypothetical protein
LSARNASHWQRQTQAESERVENNISSIFRFMLGLTNEIAPAQLRISV